MFENAPIRTTLMLQWARRAVFGLTSCLVMFGAAPLAFAGPPPSLQVPAADSERYGKEALRAHRVAEAVEYFKYAFLNDRTEDHLWYLAVTGAAAGNPIYALIDLRNYIRGADAATLHTAEASRLIVDLYRQTGHLLICGANEVFLDGGKYYVGPDFEVDVMPGEHTIALTQNGPTMRFNAIAGAPTVVDVASLAHSLPQSR